MGREEAVLLQLLPDLSPDQRTAGYITKVDSTSTTHQPAGTTLFYLDRRPQLLSSPPCRCGHWGWQLPPCCCAAQSRAQRVPGGRVCSRPGGVGQKQEQSAFNTVPRWHSKVMVMR